MGKTSGPGHNPLGPLLKAAPAVTALGFAGPGATALIVLPLTPSLPTRSIVSAFPGPASGHS